MLMQFNKRLSEGRLILALTSLVLSIILVISVFVTSEVYSKCSLLPRVGNGFRPVSHYPSELRPVFSFVCYKHQLCCFFTGRGHFNVYDFLEPTNDVPRSERQWANSVRRTVVLTGPGCEYNQLSFQMGHLSSPTSFSLTKEQ